MNIHPTNLIGKVVRLEPLSEIHIPGLCKIGFDPSIWRWMLYGEINTEEKMRQFVVDLLDRQLKGNDLPFAVIYRPNNEVAGCTRFMEIRREDRGLEIGGTWYGLKYQRSVVNTECKYLLLRHAFEVYGCIRVQFKTDLRNLRSQKAIKRIGAVQEGILRNHIIRPDGIIRHTVFYSILDNEWPEVKIKLENLLSIVNH